MWTLLCHKSQLTCQTPIGLIVYKYVSSVCKSKTDVCTTIILYCMHAQKLKWACILPGTFTSPKMIHRTTAQYSKFKSVRMYPPGTFTSPKKVHTTLVLHWKRMYPPGTFAIPKKDRTKLHWSWIKYASTQEHSQVQKGTHNAHE